MSPDAPYLRAEMQKIVNGASRQPLSGNPPRQIVLLLHGFGSSGSDLIGFVPHWQHALPDALFLAPHAPQRCVFGGGYQWWPLNGFTPQALSAGAASAAGAIDALIDRKLNQYGLTEAQIAIVGFSQGTMMALHVGLRRERRLAGIVGYSGMLTGGRDLAHQIVSRPPVLLVHGSADRVVPVKALHDAEATLRKVGVEVKTHVSPGVGHTADPVGLKMGMGFVMDAFAG